MKMPKPKFKIDEIMLVLIVAFIVMGATIYGKMNARNEPKMEAEKITNIILDDHEMSFANNGIVDEFKLNEIQNMDYSELKRHFKVKNDFCFYIEDGNGNVLLAKGPPKLNGRGIC